jgi:hypothetical protein
MRFLLRVWVELAAAMWSFRASYKEKKKEEKILGGDQPPPRETSKSGLPQLHGYWAGERGRLFQNIDSKNTMPP